MLNTATPNLVRRTALAVLGDQHLGHQKQRDAARSLRRVGQFGEYQMDDIFGQVVLATGDKDLRPGNIIMTGAIGHRFGGEDTEVSTTMGFGKAHRTGPTALVHSR